MRDFSFFLSLRKFQIMENRTATNNEPGLTRRESEARAAAEPIGADALSRRGRNGAVTHGAGAGGANWQKTGKVSS